MICHSQAPKHRLARWKARQDQKGLGLVESVMAVAILGVAGVAFVTALSAGSIAVGEHKEEAIAQSLARSQLEYTKGYTYDSEATTYPALDTPADYSLSVTVSSVPATDTDIQKITVTVSRDEQEILTVADYKVNR
jgi:type II secretory pathway pseudopilin PulG